MGATKYADLPPLNTHQQALVVKWRYLAPHWAWRMRLLPEVARLGYEESCSAALLGLTIAAQRFDESRGLSFSTFSWFYCRCEIQRAAERFARCQARTESVCSNGADGAFLDKFTSSADVLEDADHGLRKLEVERLLALLPPRWAKLVRMRFLEGMTLEATGKQLGISKERVRQLLRDSLGALRQLSKGES